MDGATLPRPGPAAHPSPDGGRTFVCYSRRDLEFVLDLASRLRDREVPVWLDLWDIGVGEDWDRTIDAALKECASVLIVLSPDAVRSDEVRGELRSALDGRKAIVPVLYRSCEIPRQLRTTQYLDLSDSGELTERQLDELAARLRGESPAGDDVDRRSWKTWSPAAWAVARLKAVGASAAGAIVLVAASGLVAELSYASLFGFEPSLSPARVLRSGVGFFGELFKLALKQTPYAALLLVPVLLLYLVARRLLPQRAAAQGVQRLLSRPGLLWSAQCAASAFLLSFSIQQFPALLPLSTVAYGGSLADRLQALRELDYASVVPHVVGATVVLAVLEAWRRRLGRKRQYRAPGDARVSLGLAVPLYVVVTAEVLLLASGHGFLNLPRSRDYTPVEVTFPSSFSDLELKGGRRLLLLLKLSPEQVYTLYCPDAPHGPRTWDIQARTVSVVPRSRASLADLLKEFESVPECKIGSGAPEEVEQ